MILLTRAAWCRGIDVVRCKCWCRMMMWTASVSLTGAGNGVGNIPWMVASPKAPLKSWTKWPEEKTRAPSCRNQHETQILQKTVLKSKKQRIKKFMKTSGNTSVFCGTQGNYDAKSCCDQWKTWQNPGILNIWCMSKCQKRWFYWRDFPPAGMIDHALPWFTMV